MKPLSRNAYKSENPQDYNVKYMQKDELDKLKSKLLTKILNELRSKYKSLLSVKKIKLENFENAFKKEIENFFDFNNPDYKKLFYIVEKDFLNKVQKIEDKVQDNMLGKTEVEHTVNSGNKIIDINKKEIKADNPFYQNKISDYLPEGRHKNKSRLIEQLNKKQSDEWAIILKKNTQKFIEESHNKNLNNIQLRISYNEELQKQINLQKELQMQRKIKENEFINLLTTDQEKKFKNEEESKRKKKKHLILINQKIMEENEKNKIILETQKNFYREQDIKIEEEIKNNIMKETLKFEENLKNKKLAEHELSNFLLRQIEEKKIKKYENKNKIKNEEKECIKILIEKFEKEKLDKLNSKKEVISKYAKDLENQIINKIETPFMNDNEKLINKNLLA